MRAPASRAVAALALLAGLAAGDACRADPALDYMLNCQGCHRPDGAGTPGSVPALRGSMARFVAVPGGREYLARVPGVAQSALGDAELAALLNWMLAYFDPEHVAPGFRPYAADEVGRLRRAPLLEVDRLRAALLARRSDPE